MDSLDPLYDAFRQIGEDPNAILTPEIARHSMSATMTIQQGAQLNYNEVHYHGLSGGI